MRGVGHVAAVPRPALAKARVLDDVKILLHEAGGIAVGGVAVGVDERLDVLVGVPEELGVEPELEFRHVAREAELVLAGDADARVVAGGLREDAVVGEGNHEVAEVGHVVPDVGVDAGGAEAADLGERVGRALVAVGGETVVAPELGRAAADVRFELELLVLREAVAVGQHVEAEVRVFLGEVPADAV